MTMLLVTTAAIVVAMILVLVRLFLGPTLYDRVLAVNVFGTITLLIISMLGFITDRPDFLDIAMLYALLNFVSTLAILKFFRYRRFGDEPDGEDA